MFNLKQITKNISHQYMDDVKGFDVVVIDKS